jgi:hypothetical protein
MDDVFGLVLVGFLSLWIFLAFLRLHCDLVVPLALAEKLNAVE